MSFDIDYHFTLIGIRSVVSDVQLAFNLNNYLKIYLKREKVDLDVYYKKDSSIVFFPVYKYEDEVKMETWLLLKNSMKIDPVEQNSNLLASNDLFNSKKEIEQTRYLIPEKKEASYLLRIDSIEDEKRILEIIDLIRQIPIITTAYSIDYNTLKSKQNLIF